MPSTVAVPKAASKTVFSMVTVFVDLSTLSLTLSVEPNTAAS